MMVGKCTYLKVHLVGNGSVNHGKETAAPLKKEAYCLQFIMNLLCVTISFN